MGQARAGPCSSNAVKRSIGAECSRAVHGFRDCGEIAANIDRSAADYDAPR
jgi:hypothetical protein